MKRTNGARDFFGELRLSPVIPAVRGPDGALRDALSGPHAAVFVLGGDVFRVLERVEEAGQRKRPAVCVNVDMVGGVSADASGLRFLAGRVEGIISTHRHVVELAKGLGLVAIQRLFAIDSGAVERGTRLIGRADPHCVEILPALALPEVLATHPGLLERPVLAGGLLKSEDDVAALLAAGASGVSTSFEGLWRPRALRRRH
ncbi:glycerol-3-phosphate responsive antiterminator [Rubrobacter marinus]|uniref:Glycerol-3-phosphate responsive antiterminator n=1 Tax=Rubrobacter marinus TaxID=2653852 RepID=A0A6G8PYE8_9ACTN|nr:glycerol-3-phosphate responsive antiterminator [Rubrobacter marinus]QIN79274.1 glycerol-3-phosphate responsive antiterminator [Rubrobacter marinus]